MPAHRRSGPLRSGAARTLRGAAAGFTRRAIPHLRDDLPRGLSGADQEEWSRRAYGSPRRPCCAPTSIARLIRSWAGSSSVGSWRSRSKRPVPISASRPNASGRTSPCLLALFSLTTLSAVQLRPTEQEAVASSAWHRKPRPTFNDILVAMRRHFWYEQGLLTSRRTNHILKPRPTLQRAMAYAICHAS